MTLVFVGLFLIIAVAVVIVALVAYPHVRQGSSVFTPEGHQLVREARDRAREFAGTARNRATSRGRAGSGAVPGSSYGGSPDLPTPFPIGYTPTRFGSSRVPGAAPRGGRASGPPGGVGSSAPLGPRSAPGEHEGAVRARGPAATAGVRGSGDAREAARTGGAAARAPGTSRGQDMTSSGRDPARRGAEPGRDGGGGEGGRRPTGRGSSLEGLPPLPTKQALYPGQGGMPEPRTRSARRARGTAVRETDAGGAGDRNPQARGPDARDRDARDPDTPGREAEGLDVRDPDVRDGAVEGPGGPDRDGLGSWRDLLDVGPVGTGAPESIDLSAAERRSGARPRPRGRGPAGAVAGRRSARAALSSGGGREWSEMITSASPCSPPGLSTALPPDAVNVPVPASSTRRESRLPALPTPDHADPVDDDSVEDDAEGYAGEDGPVGGDRLPGPGQWLQTGPGPEEWFRDGR